MNFIDFPRRLFFRRIIAKNGSFFHILEKFLRGLFLPNTLLEAPTIPLSAPTYASLGTTSTISIVKEYHVLNEIFSIKFLN